MNTYNRYPLPEPAEREQFRVKIRQRNEQLKSINVNNNENAVETALKFYENNMKYDILNDGCLHPLELRNAHDELYKSTMIAFYRSRTYGDNEIGRDNHKLRLIRDVTTSYMRFIELNENMNKEAVKTAHEFYGFSMRTTRPADALPEFFGAPDLDLFTRHKLMKPRALNKLYELRKTGRRHAEDKHRDELIKLIDRSYAWLIMQFFSMGGISLATLFFLRRLW